MSSLQHILSAAPEESRSPPAQTPAKETMPPPAVNPTMKQETTGPDTPQGDDTPNENGDEPMYTSTTTSTRRNASGSVSSVYSGNKIRHLKKEDGIPFWRKDIQYDFLKLVFYDQTKCFRKYSDGSTGYTFAEIYIDAMAKSSKCSKILKEKLLQDTEGAISMAMVCLLVNVGRMNTTLNCKSFVSMCSIRTLTYCSLP
jgi:Ino eighty subunit 1